MSNQTIHDFIQLCKEEWKINKKIKDSYIEDTLRGEPFDLYFDEYNLKWTPIESKAFEGYVMSKIKNYIK